MRPRHRICPEVKVGVLLPVTLHQAFEKKRLDLEKKLYECHQSDTYKLKLKYVKLKNYLKEICESEKKARIRNQEYLERFERVQAHALHFTTNTEKLEKLKLEYEIQIKKMLLSKKSLGLKGELKDEDREKVAVQEGINSGTAMSRDHLAHGDPKSQKPFRKKQEEEEEESWSTSSDLTVSISEDDLFLKSPEPQPIPGGKVEGEDGIEALKLIHAEQERDALSTEKNNCILQTLSSPDSEKESSTHTPTREPGQAPDSGVPRALVGQHVATLKEHDNSLKEEATALLRKAPTEECGHRSAIHSSESSCSLPSILNDNSGIKEAKFALWLNSVPTREQEVSNGCGDKSKKENMAADIPITETEAYQLLKKAILQGNTNQTENRFQKADASVSHLSETEAYQLLKKAILQGNTNQTENRFQKADASVSHLSGLNIGSGAFETKTANKIAWEAGFSSSEGSPLSRHENKKKLMIKLKSNALWDESDDSDSEIEAALRPRNHNTDDSDDFYD
nr:centrosomal protein kizuna isoform X2 [Chlorocebus sabaeus]